jgi:hypothetical protein
VNFHALAAASGARFHRSTETIPGGSRFVLLLFPRRLHRAARAAAALRDAGKHLLVSFKECGRHQIARQMAGPLAAFWMRRVLSRADAALCTSPASEAFFAGRADAPPVLSVATPYPVDVEGWSFDRPLAARAGIFVGTREWTAPSRRHAEAVALALDVAGRAGCRVTVVNVDGDAGSRRLSRLEHGARLRVVEGPLPFPRYLEEMAGHRIVLQRDASEVPGQVAGDALLCGMPCLGGNGMVDRLAFPGLPGAASEDREVADASHRLLRDDAAWTECVASMRLRADAELSFAAFRRAWARLTSARSTA